MHQPSRTGQTYSSDDGRQVFTARRWWVNGGEMFVVGMTAAVVAYTIGNLLGGLA